MVPQDVAEEDKFDRIEKLIIKASKTKPEGRDGRRGDLFASGPKPLRVIIVRCAVLDCFGGHRY